MKKDCRNCCCMKAITENGTKCHCRVPGVSSGIVEFRDRIVPFQEKGCQRWGIRRDDKIYRQPPRFYLPYDD